MLTIKFVFNYSLDTNHFFNTQTKKDMLEYAGKMLGERLGDSLTAISPSGSNKWTATITNPATGGDKTFSNLSVSANTIIVYAGGRNISQLGIGGSGGFTSNGSTTWTNLVRSRGQSGAVSSTSPTDVAPKVGSITFDTSGANWYFSRTTSTLGSNQSDFISVAMHELTHILGINNGSKGPWRNLISSGKFNGAKTKAVYHAAVPVDSGLAHFASGVKYDGLEVAMDPELLRGTRKFHGPIDFAALDDIGWDILTNDDSIYRAQQKMAHIRDPFIGGSESSIFNGSIESAKDVDFYRIYADAGTKISINVKPSGFDSYLRLYNAAGSEITHGDQGYSGGNDYFDLSAPRSDYFWIAVSSYGNRNYNPFTVGSGSGGTTGSYSLGISLEDPDSLRASSLQSSDATAATGTYTGATTVNAGTLRVSGNSQAGNAVVLQSAAFANASSNESGTLLPATSGNGTLTVASGGASAATLSSIAFTDASSSGTFRILGTLTRNPLAGEATTTAPPETDVLDASLVDEALIAI